jgi:proton-translocating NADH-quinone oxidoreductase chain N
MNSSAFIWLIMIPLFSSPVVYLIGRLGVQQNIVQRRTYLVRWVSFAALLAACVVFIFAVRDYFAGETSLIKIEAIWLQVDGLSLLVTMLILILGMLVVLFSGPYMAEEIGEEKYYAMLLAMIGLMIGLSSASDLFNLWVWFEAMAVSSYLLVAFYRRQPAALEAGMKYLVQSATGSVFVLLGIALVLGSTGTLNLEHLRTSPQSSPVLLAAGALFIIGFGVKAALVPLHTWLPDAHSQAPSGISAMLSGVVIEMGLIALLRVLTALSGSSQAWGIILMAFGAVNMLLGNLLALRQVQVKRLLAYSSLSQMGYMLLGLGIAYYTGQSMGAQGAVFHLINHGLMKGLAFLAVGALLYAMSISLGSHAPLTVDDLSGASKRYPITALTMSLAVLGLAGLPPLAGFMSKWQIFLAGFQSHNTVIDGLVIFAALNSVLSLGYYAPLVNRIYRKEQSAAVTSGSPLPNVMLVPLTILGLAVIVLGFWPSLLSWITQPAGIALMKGF